jgi:hypothetical protein
MPTLQLVTRRAFSDRQIWERESMYHEVALQRMVDEEARAMAWVIKHSPALCHRRPPAAKQQLAKLRQ